MHRRRGFTLIELLVVIAIVAVLAVAVILTLNPAQLLARARDSSRVADLAALTKAIALYQLDAPSGGLGTAGTVYVSLPDSSPTCASYTLPTLPSGYTYACEPEATFRNADGTGWLPLNFTGLSVSTPFSTLPVDPRNTDAATLYYAFVTNGTNFVVRATPESTSYGERAVLDGGPSDSYIEVGSDISLSPPDDTGPTSTGYVLASGTPVLINAPNWTEATTGWNVDESPSGIGELNQAVASSTVAPSATFKGFSFGIPSGSTIENICVQLDNVSVSSALSGTQQLRVSVSWDGGTAFTTFNSSMPDLSDTSVGGANYYFTGTSGVQTSDPGLACTTWGRTWTDTELSSSNFAVRVAVRNTDSTNTTLRFDTVKAKVYYTQ